MSTEDGPNPLRHALTPEQETAIAVIAEAYMGSGVWPVFQYVEGTLDDQHGIDASAVLSSLPTIGRYGLVWPSIGGLLRMPGDRVGLTVAGLSRVPSGGPVVSVFMQLLSYLTDRQRHIRLKPEEVQEDRAHSDDVMGHLRPRSVTSRQVFELMEHEPATWRGNRSLSADGRWTVSMERELRRYRSTSGLEDYLDRILTWETPPPHTKPPVYVSPFGLPATIDYLDAVWRLATGKGLFALPGATVTLKLALGCATEDEFDSRVSAFSSVLYAMKIPTLVAPDAKLGTLERLRIYLVTDRSVQGQDRVERSIDTLKSIVRVRVGAQHPKTSSGAVAARRNLGLEFPPSDWATAWATIQSRAIEALDSIREEVEGLISRS